MGLTRRSRAHRAAPRRPIDSPRIACLRLAITLIACLSAALAGAADRRPLVSAVIRGSTIYPAPELFGVYGDQLGKPITAESARTIATRLAARYTEDGYSRPGVTIDDRLASSGVLVFNVIETRISSVEIQGDPGPYENKLRRLGDRVDGSALLRTDELQSTVRQMSDLPGLRLTASTSRDEVTPGSYQLKLDTEFRRVGNTLRLTNRGTDEIGPIFLLGQTTFNGLANGRADVGLLFGSALEAAEFQGIGLTGSLRPPGRRLSLQASGFRSRSNPRETPADRDDRYLRDRATIGAVLPLVDSSRRRLLLTPGLRAEDLSIDRNRSRLRDERLRMAEVGLRWISTPSRSRQFAAGIKLIRGLDGLGAGLRADDLVEDPRRPNFTSVLLDYVRYAEINPRWHWRLDAFGQHSGDVLAYSERFKIGGDRLGRGFEVAEIAGDRGLGARIEVLRRLDTLESRAGALSVYGTYDLAAAWKNDQPGRESAATAGVGLALTGRTANGRLELAKPLTHPDVEGREDLRVFVEVSLRW